jgi:hypothetical protein
MCIDGWTGDSTCVSTVGRVNQLVYRAGPQYDGNGTSRNWKSRGYLGLCVCVCVCVCVCARNSSTSLFPSLIPHADSKPKPAWKTRKIKAKYVKSGATDSESQYSGMYACVCVCSGVCICVCACACVCVCVLVSVFVSLSVSVSVSVSSAR